MTHWEPVSLGSRLHHAPVNPIRASTHGRLSRLPFNDLQWEDFEKLQWQVLEVVEGLSKAYAYGDRGQEQFGIDIIGFDAQGSGVALQSKNYKRFTPGDLRNAVKKFQSTERPFPITRLIVGVASLVNSTHVINELIAQQEKLKPLVLELWDANKLSNLLRDRPKIVIEFFGESTAREFCYPYELEVLQVPAPDVVAVQEAIAQTPEVATGAQEDLDGANEKDPENALALIEKAQEKLRQAGFAGYAQKYEHRRLELAAKAGDPEEAARSVLDSFWDALDQGQSSAAQQKLMLIQDFGGEPSAKHIIDEYQLVLNRALELYENPLGTLPAVNDLTIGDPVDQAHLFILAGETALANFNQQWLVQASPHLIELSASPEVNKVQKIRLRLLNAEATSDWAQLYAEARTSALGNDIGSLVTARYARIHALTERFQEADALWSTAAGAAALARQWDLASTWVLSQRMFRLRWQPFSGNELLPLQLSLKKMGTSIPLFPMSTSPYETAVTALRKENLRVAAISAQKTLRDAILISDWYGENRAREILGEILAQADEPQLAARHLIRSASINQIVTLAGENPNSFIDLTEDLNASNYWTLGTLYRHISIQADLIPDSLFGSLSQHLVSEIGYKEKGEMQDRYSSNYSRYRNAIKALGAISARLSVESANTILSHFEKQPPLSEHEYRMHDEDEGISVAHIVLSHPSLAERGIAHLVGLVNRSLRSEKELILKAIAHYPEYSRPLLEKFADQDKRWAQELLSRMGLLKRRRISVEALERLSSPLQNTPGQYVSGTSAVSDSLLVHGVDPDVIASTIRSLLAKADEPQVSSLDRGEYLVAASNLVNFTELSDRFEFFDQAIRLGYSPTPSEYDQLTERYTHKLAFFRTIGEPTSSRTKAALLAAKSVTNKAQRKQALELIYRLLAENSDHWLGRALFILQDIPEEDLPFLASQGWQVRSVAAHLWGIRGGALHLGERLARDPDVRVRRALAQSISQKNSDHHTGVIEILREDPAYSVHSVLRTISC